jgi:hypothetical protein
MVNSSSCDDNPHPNSVLATHAPHATGVHGVFGEDGDASPFFVCHCELASSQEWPAGKANDVWADADWEMRMSKRLAYTEVERMDKTSFFKNKCQRCCQNKWSKSLW